MHSLLTLHVPTMCFNRSGVESMGPTVGPLCAHYALMTRPLCVSTAVGFNQWACGGATMRTLCAHDAPINVFKSLGVQSLVPKCDHYAPTMRSRCAPYACGLVWGSIDALTVGQPCAH